VEHTAQAEWVGGQDQENGILRTTKLLEKMSLVTLQMSPYNGIDQLYWHGVIQNSFTTGISPI
jgi:hypothetical protein